MGSVASPLQVPLDALSHDKHEGYPKAPHVPNFQPYSSRTGLSGLRRDVPEVCARSLVPPGSRSWPPAPGTFWDKKNLGLE